MGYSLTQAPMVRMQVYVVSFRIYHLRLEPASHSGSTRVIYCRFCQLNAPFQVSGFTSVLVCQINQRSFPHSSQLSLPRSLQYFLRRARPHAQEASGRIVGSTPTNRQEIRSPEFFHPGDA